MPHSIKRYGWIPDLPDQRDYLYAAPFEAGTPLPSKVDLRQNCPPVYDQGQLGSCTANAIAGAIEFDRMKQNLIPLFTPSRLFIYYNERSIEGTTASDSGAQIRDGIKSIGAQGVCPEPEWPYDISKFENQPPASCYQDAVAHKAILYKRLVRDLNQMRGCLASGYPFVLGITVYASFESQAVAQSGQVPMPASNEQLLGGHAVLAVGYDDDQQTLLVRNSWGPSWGMNGYCTLPYGYVGQRNLSSDFWVIRMMES